MSTEFKVPPSKEPLQPIYSNHVRMSVGGKGVIFFDFRTIVPDFRDYKDELEDKKIVVDFDEKIVPPHTRLALPMDAVVALRQMLLDSIQAEDEQEE